MNSVKLLAFTTSSGSVLYWLFFVWKKCFLFDLNLLSGHINRSSLALVCWDSEMIVLHSPSLCNSFLYLLYLIFPQFSLFQGRESVCHHTWVIPLLWSSTYSTPFWSLLQFFCVLRYDGKTRMQYLRFK